jgi:hypothetical protein
MAADKREQQTKAAAEEAAIMAVKQELLVDLA